MAQWNETFKSHPVHSSLINFETVVGGIDWFQFTPDVPDLLSRIPHIAKYIRNRLEKIDPILAVPDTLTSINNAIKVATTELSSFLSNKNDAHLANANTNLNSALTHLTTLHTITPSDDSKAPVEGILNYRDTSEQIIKSLGKKVSELETRIVTLVGRSDEVQKAFQEIRTQIEAQKGRLDNAIAQFQQQFSDTEQKRRNDFDAQLKEQTTDYKSFKEKIDKELKQFVDSKSKETSELLDGFQKQGSISIQFLEERKKQASDLLKIISNIGVTGNFNKIANSDRRWAIGLRIIALLFLTGTAGGAIYTVTHVIKEGFDWKIVLFRITTTLILAIPGFYAAKESEKYRRSEQRYRRMELELASIDPYLESLPEDKRHTLKETLAQRFFGQPEITEVVTDREEIVTTKSLLDLLKTIFTNLVKK